MNDQRSVIYTQRKEILNQENSYDFFLELMQDATYKIVDYTIAENEENENYKVEVIKEIKNNIGLVLNEIKASDKEKIKTEIISIIKDNLEKKINKIGIENFNIILKQLIIQVLDQQWKQHLLSLDNLRQGIGLRAYAQRDPLNEYKREAFTMFENMMASIRTLTTRIIIQIEFKEEVSQKSKNTNYRERLRKKPNN